MTTYRCTNCGRSGRDFAFWWLAPLTPEQRESALARDATPPEPPLVAEPCVMCPRCKRVGAVVDADGRPASHDTRAPQPPSLTLAEEQVEKAVTRALRARTATGGRAQHGAVA